MDFGAALFLGLLSVFSVYIGKKRSFFSLDPQPWTVPVYWFHVLISFAIYFVINLCVLFTSLFFRTYALSNSWSLQDSSKISFVAACSIACLLLLYIHKISHIGSFIWGRIDRNCFSNNLKAVLLTTAIALPAVLFLSECLHWLISVVFHIHQLPEQLAVQFLKMTFAYPFYFLLTFLMIVVLAPLTEEILFRGILQSFIRQHLGAKTAIFITSFAFSFFHYSPLQQLSNIPILSSLFLLSLFLSFIYEKQRSLSAPMLLHAVFNLINILNLYFSKGI